MYTYRRGKIGPTSIFFIVLFIIITIGMGYLVYIDKGRFWDILPFVSIPVIIISLILIIFNFIRRTKASSFFIIFFLLSITGLILSDIFGPSVLAGKAQKSYDNEDYSRSIDYYNTLLENYPNSRFAGNALKNISFTYYLNGNYLEAIDSFVTAINSEAVSGNDLETKKILEDSYSKLAQNYYDNEKYDESGESYMDAVKVLEEIKNDFPDTNEAFIAVYKIPKYLYDAALSFNENKSWEKSIKALEKIISDHSDSEYFGSAGTLLFDAYINHAVELSGDIDHMEESIEEFLNILDLEVEDRDYGSVPEYKKRKIFSNILQDTLKSIAGNKYSSGNYKKAAFLYEIIIKYNPELEEEINPLLIDSKINLITSLNYNEFVVSVPERKIWGYEKSMLIIENNTEFDLIVYLKGPESKIIRAEKNSATEEIEISAGKYRAASELDNPNILPYYGIVTYEEGQMYREEYTISD